MFTLAVASDPWMHATGMTLSPRTTAEAAASAEIKRLLTLIH